MANKKRKTREVPRQLLNVNADGLRVDQELFPDELTLTVLKQQLKKLAKHLYPGCEWVTLVVKPKEGSSMVIPVHIKGMKKI